MLVHLIIIKLHKARHNFVRFSLINIATALAPNHYNMINATQDNLEQQMNATVKRTPQLKLLENVTIIWAEKPSADVYKGRQIIQRTLRHTPSTLGKHSESLSQRVYLRRAIVALPCAVLLEIKQTHSSKATWSIICK